MLEYRHDECAEPLGFRPFDSLYIERILGNYLAHEVVGKESVVEKNFIHDEVDFQLLAAFIERVFSSATRILRAVNMPKIVLLLYSNPTQNSYVGWSYFVKVGNELVGVIGTRSGLHFSNLILV